MKLSGKMYEIISKLHFDNLLNIWLFYVQKPNKSTYCKYYIEKKKKLQIYGDPHMTCEIKIDLMAKKVRIDFYNLLIPDYVLLMCYVILVKWLKQTNKLWELFLNSWPQYLFFFFGMWGAP